MKLVSLTVAAAVVAVIPMAPTQAQASEHCGRASWYALTSMTASGERMDPAKLTAAHRNLKFGTKLEVINQSNGRSVVVRINDRGPFIHNRVIDLSKAAANELGFINAGVASICYNVIG